MHIQLNEMLEKFGTGALTASSILQYSLGNSQPESTDTDPRVAPFDLKSSVSVSLLLFSLLIGLFWAFQTVDMVGDVYGSGTGMLAAIVVSVYPLLYCLALLQFNFGDSTENYDHLESEKPEL